MRVAHGGLLGTTNLPHVRRISRERVAQWFFEEVCFSRRPFLWYLLSRLLATTPVSGAQDDANSTQQLRRRATDARRMGIDLIVSVGLSRDQTSLDVASGY